MKKFLFAILPIFSIFLLTSCDGEKCIKCTEINGTAEQNLCSTSIEERNDFQVTWIHAGYNCEEVSE